MPKQATACFQQQTPADRAGAGSQYAWIGIIAEPLGKCLHKLATYEVATQTGSLTAGEAQLQSISMESINGRM